MKIKTSALIGPALNWAVAVCEGHKPPLLRILRGNVALPDLDDPMVCDYLEYSEDWSHGGPIIERELIDTSWQYGGRPYWSAWGNEHPDAIHEGPTPLIAAMRCFVASKLGYEVDVPEELV